MDHSLGWFPRTLSLEEFLSSSVLFPQVINLA
jgi:hypothetical protein